METLRVKDIFDALESVDSDALVYVNGNPVTAISVTTTKGEVKVSIDATVQATPVSE